MKIKLVVVGLLLAWAGAGIAQEANLTKKFLNAAQGGRLKTVRSLVEVSKVDINTTDQYGRTGLYLAAEAGHLDVVEYLLLNNAPINQITGAMTTGWTPLHAAANAGHLDVVRHLIQQGADVNLLTGRHETPSILAARAGYDANKSGDTLVANFNDVALQQRYAEIVYLLMIHGADLGGVVSAALEFIGFEERLLGDSRNRQAINYNTVAFGRWADRAYTMVKMVLGYMSLMYAQTPHTEGEMSLAWLPESLPGSFDTTVAQLLFDEMRTNIESLEQSQLINNYIAVLRRVATSIPYCNEREGKILPFHWCIHDLSMREGTVLAMIQWLIEEAGIDPMTADADGNTPLHCAARRGLISVVRYLGLLNPEVIDARNSEGRTALYEAVMAGQGDVLRVLQELGADINTLDNEGQRVIQRKLKDPAWVKRLALCGANLDGLLSTAVFYKSIGYQGTIDVLTSFLDDRGVNASPWALTEAAWRPDYALVRQLVNSGADIRAGLETGVPALHYLLLTVTEQESPSDQLIRLLWFDELAQHALTITEYFEQFNKKLDMRYFKGALERLNGQRFTHEDRYTIAQFFAFYYAYVQEEEEQTHASRGYMPLVDDHRCVQIVALLTELETDARTGNRLVTHDVDTTVLAQREESTVTASNVASDADASKKKKKKKEKEVVVDDEDLVKRDETASSVERGDGVAASDLYAEYERYAALDAGPHRPYFDELRK